MVLAVSFHQQVGRGFRLEPHPFDNGTRGRDGVSHADPRAAKGAQSALGIDGLKKPFFAQVGDYPLYIAPPHSPNSGFGDLAYNPPSKGIGGFMDYHIRGGAASATLGGDRNVAAPECN